MYDNRAVYGWGQARRDLFTYSLLSIERAVISPTVKLWLARFDVPEEALIEYRRELTLEASA